MKTRLRTVVVAAALLAPALIFPVFAGERSDSPGGRISRDRQTGVEEIVKLGRRTRLSGALLQEGAAWFLRAGDEVYRLQLGTSRQLLRSGISLETGKRAVVNGFLHQEDIAVITIFLDGRTYRFLADDGSPAPAGRKRSGRGREDGGGGDGGGGGGGNGGGGGGGAGGGGW